MYCDIGMYDYYKQVDYNNCHLTYYLSSNESEWRNYIIMYSKLQMIMCNAYLESNYSILKRGGLFYRYLSLLISKKLGIIEINKQGKIIDFDKAIYIKKLKKQVNPFKYNSSIQSYYAIKLPSQKPLERQLEMAMDTTMVYLVKTSLLDHLKLIYDTAENYFQWSSLEKDGLLPAVLEYGKYGGQLFITNDLIYPLIIQCKNKEEIINYINIAIQMRKNEKILEKL